MTTEQLAQLQNLFNERREAIDRLAEIEDIIEMELSPQESAPAASNASYPDTCAESILSFRRKRCMTQKTLATLIGCTQSAVAQWERSAKSPSRLVLIAMSHIDSDNREYWASLARDCGTEAPETPLSDDTQDPGVAEFLAVRARKVEATNNRSYPPKESA